MANLIKLRKGLNINLKGKGRRRGDKSKRTGILCDMS